MDDMESLFGSLDVGDVYGFSDEELENSETFMEPAIAGTGNDTPVINMQGKSVQEILGLTSLRERVGYSHHAVQHNELDLYFYEDMVDLSSKLQECHANGTRILPTFRYLCEDLFLALHMREVKLHPPVKMHKSVKVNYSIFTALIATQEFKELRALCVGSQGSSGIGVEIMADRALEIYNEMLRSIQEYNKKKESLDELLEEEDTIDELQEEMDNLNDKLLNMERSCKGDVNTMQEEHSDELQAINTAAGNNEISMEEAKQLAEQFSQECEELIEDMAPDNKNRLVNGVADMIDASMAEMGVVSLVCNTFGIGRGGGSSVKMPMSQQKRLIEAFRRSPELQKIVKLAGRLIATGIAEQKKKSREYKIEITSVTTGDEIKDTLPSERMNLAMDVTKKDFYRRYGDKSLLVFAKSANSQKAKGPVIVCVDTSGSMSGQKEVWSKAMAFTILEITQMQKRDFACILYDTEALDPIIIGKDEVSADKIIDIANTFLGGGTNFQAPLEKALALLEKSMFKEADIMFITDGDSVVSDSFLRRYKNVKEEKEFNATGIVVNVSGHSSSSSLSEFCDSVVTISSLAEMEDNNSDVNKAIFNAI